MVDKDLESDFETEASEEYSSFDEISDDTEDGIFAPEPAAKTKKSSALMVNVAVIALLAAGGGYVYMNPQILEGSNSSSSVQIDAASVVADVPSSEAVVEPVVAEANVAPAESAPVVENVSAEAAAVVPDAVVEAQPAEPAAAVENVSADAAAVVPDAAVEAQPPETVEIVETPDAAKDSSSVVADLPAPVVEETQVNENNKAVVTPPADEALASAGQVKAEVADADLKNELAQTTQGVATSQGKVIATAPEQSITYFDAPPGKVIADLDPRKTDTNKDRLDDYVIVHGKNKPAKIQKAKAEEVANFVASPEVEVKADSMNDAVTAANRALALGRYDAAKQMYADLYKKNPRDSRILMGRAVTYQKLGENDAAIEAYRDALAVNPNNAEAAVNIAGLMRGYNPQIALQKLLSLRSSYPDNGVIAGQIGVIYASLGDTANALQYLSVASRLEPQNPQHYYNMAIICERLGNKGRAVQMYEKALEVDAVSGGSGQVSRDVIYDRLSRLR